MCPLGFGCMKMNRAPLPVDSATFAFIALRTSLLLAIITCIFSHFPFSHIAVHGRYRTTRFQCGMRDYIFFFFLLHVFIWKAECWRDVFHPLVHPPHTCSIWDRLGPHTQPNQKQKQELHWVSHVHGRTLCRSVEYLGLNPGTSVWDAGDQSNGVTHCIPDTPAIFLFWPCSAGERPFVWFSRNLCIVIFNMGSDSLFAKGWSCGITLYSNYVLWVK